MSAPATTFSPVTRLLHWSMALLILAMLFIGVGMLSGAPAHYHGWVTLHQSIGVTVFGLALLRLAYRLRHPAPPLPADLPRWQRALARGSHLLLYALMLGLPLVGWAMRGAADYPVTLAGGLQLPQLLAPHAALHAQLRRLHALLAYLLFASILLHLAAALFHALIRRDGVLASMTWQRRRQG